MAGSSMGGRARRVELGAAPIRKAGTPALLIAVAALWVAMVPAPSWAAKTTRTWDRHRAPQVTDTFVLSSGGPRRARPVDRTPPTSPKAVHVADATGSSLA